MFKQGRRLLSALLTLALLAALAAPGLAADTAAVIRLAKTEGTVEVSKSSGKKLTLLNNMRLYNGYHVTTGEESYAWINLDDVKLIKEDAASEVEVRKNGKHLEVNLWSGNLFFDVAEKLEPDETLKISTSTMAVGVRGTSGWLRMVDRWTAQISILEGEVHCSVNDPVTGQTKTETLQGGETVECMVYPQEREGDKCDIVKTNLTVAEIPGFVLADLVQDVSACEKIKEESGLAILETLAQEAGGDPSGLSPDGKTVSPEVLGEVQQRQEAEQASLGEMMEQVAEEMDKQPSDSAGEKALPKDSAAPEGGQETGVPTPPVNPAPGPAPDPEPPTAPEPPSEPEPPTEPDPDPNPEPPVDPGPDPEEPPAPAVYTVTFDANGGLWDSGAATDVTTGESSAIIFPDDPTRIAQVTGTYTFDGWFTSATGGTQVQPGYTFTGDTELYAHWTLSGIDYTLESDMLTILGTGAIPDYSLTRAAAPWSGKSFRTLVISEGITSIGNYAFSGSSGLTSLNIPEGVTSIGDGAFSVCIALQSVIINEGTTTIGSGAFTVCPVMHTIEIPKTVTTIGEECFTGCSQLSTISFGGTRDQWNNLNAALPDHMGPGNVFCTEGIDYALNTATKTLTIRGTGEMENYRMEHDASMTTVTSAPWYTDDPDAWGTITALVIEDGITSIGSSAFCGIGPVEHVEIPSSVTEIGQQAFCSSSIQSVTILGNVTTIGDSVFSGCGHLKSVQLPDTLEVLEQWAFQNCASLKSLELPESVKTIELYAFSGSGLLEITIPGSVESIDSSAFDSTNLTTINFGGTQEQWAELKVTLPSGATVNCTG